MDRAQIPDFLQRFDQISLPADIRIFKPGDQCSHFYYVIDGCVRVDLMTRTGKPVTLYRFGAGESCILVTSCLFSGDLYNAIAMAEKPVTALAISRSDFFALLHSSKDFCKLVFTSFAERLASIMVKIEEVTSIPIENRLAIRALELADEQNPVVVTHEQLAADLGTAREVVSRKLANWESHGWIERSRGSFVIINRDQLALLTRDF